jgi:hypothetical protein
MFWFHLIFSNCIIFRLNSKQMLAQNIPFLGYTSLPSAWEPLDDFTETTFLEMLQHHPRTVVSAGSLPLLKLCTQLTHFCV